MGEGSKRFEISPDIWFHVAEHIAPQDVQTFALICRQTSELVNTRRFWRTLYRKYCQKSTTKQWILNLPEYLQMDVMRKNDAKWLRYQVIKALFYCYTPLINRVKEGYTLDMLVGRSCTVSWHERYECIWIMCHKFCSQSLRNISNEESPFSVREVVNDWETLSDDSPATAKQFVNLHEGVCVLIIFCDHFIPFPVQLLYENKRSNIRLVSTRLLLTTDMRSSNLELDFVDTSNVVTTIKYLKILKYKVLPWWHPDYDKFLK